jgi:hypothetical protein
MLRSLSEQRHRPLLLEIRERLAADPRPVAAVEGAFGHAMRGDHAAAIRTARAIVARAPDHRFAHMILATELCFAGELGPEARASAGWLERTPAPLVGYLQAAALVRLLDGDREAAARMSRRAEQMLTGYGFAPDVLPMVGALRATLRGDAAELDRLRRQPSAHYDPDSLMWQRLHALTSRN